MINAASLMARLPLAEQGKLPEDDEKGAHPEDDSTEQRAFSWGSC